MAFTEKGKAAIEKIINKYSANDIFTAAELGVASGVLTSLAKDGYLIRQDTKPVSYVCSIECRGKIELDLPKKFTPYSLEECKKQTEMSYQELVNYCLDKYGRVSGTYFCTPEMKSQNNKIKRGGEGLYIHHIMEDRVIMLGNSLFAREQPWEYQMPHNLVYCNIFEHLLLHIHITNEYDETKMEDKRVLPGIGGVINHLFPQIQDKYMNNQYSAIENIEFEQYSNIILPLITKMKSGCLYQKFLRSRDYQARMGSSCGPAKIIEKMAKPKKGFFQRTQRIKRDDGLIYNNLSEASTSIGGGKGKAKKIKKAIEEHTKYGGFYWEYIE